IQGNVISDNYVLGDDGLAGGIHCNKCSPTITANLFTGNFSKAVGGVHCLEGSATISGNMFDGNVGLVGGICCTDEGAPNVSCNIVIGNEGFGIACFPNTSPLIMNNLIAKNRASFYTGAGIWCWGSPAIISNNTIAGNDDFGIICYVSLTVIENCILWDNDDDLWNTTATYSCIGDDDRGPGNIHQLPMFVSGPLGAYYLDPASACIDAGNRSAESASLDDFTTQADGYLDAGTVDIGFHYPLP
ncbi:right-handed parallel beta-helix repeat-containing protein, partial [bacterium]|nr:right-handed parallel beta-helix repeat-containing protein [bacterium]